MDIESLWINWINVWNDLWCLVAKHHRTLEQFPWEEFESKWRMLQNVLDSMTQQQIPQNIVEDVEQRFECIRETLEITFQKMDTREYLGALPDGLDKIFCYYWALTYIKWSCQMENLGRLGNLQLIPPYFEQEFGLKFHLDRSHPYFYLWQYWVAQIFALAEDVSLERCLPRPPKDAFWKAVTLWITTAWEVLSPYLQQDHGWQVISTEPQPLEAQANRNPNIVHPIRYFGTPRDWCPGTNPWLWFFFVNSQADSWNSLEPYLLDLELVSKRDGFLQLLPRLDFVYDTPFLQYLLARQTKRTIVLQRKYGIFCHVWWSMRQFMPKISGLTFSVPSKIYRACRVWLRNPHKLARFMLVGDTGVGKTMFMAMASGWLHYQKQNNQTGEEGRLNQIDSEVETNGTPFCASDFHNPDALLERLKKCEDDVSRSLIPLFSSQFQKDLENSKEISPDRIVNEFNLLLNLPLYKPYLFAHVALREKTKSLASSNPQGTELIRFNRLLLQDAYPNEIPKTPYLQRVFQNIVQRGAPPIGTDNMTDLIFELKWHGYFTSKKILLQTQDYRGVLSSLGKKTNSEERTQFLQIVGSSQIVLFLLAPDKIPGLLPWNIGNNREGIENLKMVMNMLQEVPGRREFCLAFTKCDTVPGFIAHVNKVRHNYGNTVQSHRLCYSLINNQTWLWKQAVYSYDNFREIVLHPYKSRTHPLYNLEWARSLSIILDVLHEQHTFSNDWCAKMEIFFRNSGVITS